MLETETVWMDRLRAVVRRTVADVGAAEPHAVHDLLRSFAAALAPAPDRVHRTMLIAVLVDLCRQVVERLHAGEQAACPCHAAAWTYLGPIAGSIDGDPREAFATWTEMFCRAYAAAHPPRSSARAGALMRGDPATPWSMATLARGVQTSPLRLRRDFNAHFGMRVSSYLQLVRAMRAVALLGTDRKVEAIAWDVGYRSKKDLYAALRRWVGGSPTDVRALSDEERLWLERLLLRRTISAAVGGRERSARPVSRRRPRRRQREPPPRR